MITIKESSSPCKNHLLYSPHASDFLILERNWRRVGAPAPLKVSRPTGNIWSTKGIARQKHLRVCTNHIYQRQRAVEQRQSAYPEANSAPSRSAPYVPALTHMKVCFDKGPDGWAVVSSRRRESKQGTTPTQLQIGIYNWPTSELGLIWSGNIINQIKVAYSCLPVWHSLRSWVRPSLLHGSIS